jgi:undecaprenyl-diphosphatase
MMVLFRRLALAGGALLLVLLGYLGGSGQPWEVALLRSLGAWRGAEPQATGWVIALTHAGGAPVLLSVALTATLLLWWRGKRRQAVAMAATVISGRLGLELLKYLVDRPRPSFEAHPVFVFSQSFPSGHAGNSMITYVALALFAVPERWRGSALAAAIVLALAIGATRPVLGVHWPSDVIAGWIYGLAVTSVAWTLSRPRGSAA